MSEDITDLPNPAEVRLLLEDLLARFDAAGVFLMVYKDDAFHSVFGGNRGFIDGLAVALRDAADKQPHHVLEKLQGPTQ